MNRSLWYRFQNRKDNAYYLHNKTTSVADVLLRAKEKGARSPFTSHLCLNFSCVTGN
ncbi:Uncharacterised protein [Vibrio cholerae]|nr:Uncharacterised protein [Vibrio cholerae]